MTDKPQWQLLEWYRGCPIEHRPGMQRRGYASHYHNHYHDGHIGTFVHHSLSAAHAHIDKLHQHLGDRVELTAAEWEAYQAPTPQRGRPPGIPNPNGGRPRLGTGRRVESTITLDPDLHRLVSGHAWARGNSLSESINILLSEAIRSHEIDPDNGEVY